MEPEYSVNSLLINKISSENKDKTFVFISNTKGKEEILSISGRSQSEKIDMGEFLKRAVKNIPNSLAGGHFHASGAGVPAEFLQKFKENLIKAYEGLKD